MRTTQQWWNEVSSDLTKMNDWLKKQYHGEVTAEARIRGMIDQFNLTGKQKLIISRIADDEKRHAEWVKDLLIVRGITPEVLEKEERYWNETLPEPEALSFEELCAIGHLAEDMRLDRITLLASDDRFKDIAEVFQRILPDETFHTKAFASLTTPEHIEAARPNHEKGMNAIGLVA